MSRNPPRYDVPNAAPEPLRFVQEFVNTTNLESRDDWLAAWLEWQGVLVGRAGLESAAAVRDALRELLYANNSEQIVGDPFPVLDEAARAARLTIDFERGELRATRAGADGLLGRVLGIAFRAMADGTWARLKACRNDHCRWAFYDYSKNRSAAWCSMQLCGNRAKARAYRRRHPRGGPEARTAP